MGGDDGSVMVAEAPDPGREHYRPGVRIAKTQFSRNSLKERASQKLVLMLFGDPDGGKTTQALLAALGPYGTGRVLALTFDNKTKRVKVGAFQNRKEIWVVDAQQHYLEANAETENWSAKVTIDFVDYVLETLGRDFAPHFILFDGYDRYSKITQGHMRWLHNLAPSQGFKQRSWWKDNRDDLIFPVRKGLAFAAIGVIVTSYVEKAFADEGAEQVYQDKERKPTAATQIAYVESDIAVELRTSYNSTIRSKSYEAYVQKCKPDLVGWLTLGETYDLTPPKRGEMRPLPWGPAYKAAFDRADLLLKDIVVKEWPSESADPADIPSAIPPPMPSPGEPMDPSPTEAPTVARPVAVRAAPVAPPVTLAEERAATAAALKAAGVDPSAPPAVRTSSDEV